MFRQTLLIAFGFSLILVIPVLMGERTCSIPSIPEVAQILQANHEDPFGVPHLVACDPRDVAPALYAVMLKRGYPLKQHIRTTGTDLSLSLNWVSPESSEFGLIYTATLDNSTLAVVLKDRGVKLVECHGKSRVAGTVESLIPAQDIGRSLLWL